MCSWLQLFLILGVHSMVFSSLHKQDIGLKEFVFEDKSRKHEGKSRRLEVAIWYPTKQKSPYEKIDVGIWKIKDVIRNACLPVGKKLPLIIFSHGYSGNQWTNTWFAEYMAENGYMVACIRHEGNNYGNMVPEICVRPWHRPQDMSFVLDCLLKHPELQNNIDVNRIGAAGFSQGGVACMWLSGVRAQLNKDNIKKQITVIDDPESRAFHFKNISSERLDTILDDFTQHDFEDANRSYFDKRFKTFFVMAPGIDEENIMFTQQGLSYATAPMHIIVGQADEGALEQSHFFAQYISQCIFTLIPGEVGHLTLLNEGTDQSKISNPAYTMDHPSVDRSIVHQFVADKAICFFNKYFKTEEL